MSTSPATEHRQARRFLGHDLERQEPVLRGARAPVGGNGLELYVRAGHLLHEPVRPAADRAAREHVVALRLEVLLRHDHPLGGQPPRQVLRDDQRRLLGDDHDAVGRRPLDVLDEHAQRLRVARRRALAHRTLEAPLHVLGRQLVAVVEPNTAAEMERPPLVVRRRLPARGDAVVGRELAVGRHADQVVEDLVEIELHDVAAEHGVEGLRRQAREGNGQVFRPDAGHGRAGAGKAEQQGDDDGGTLHPTSFLTMSGAHDLRRAWHSPPSGPHARGRGTRRSPSAPSGRNATGAARRGLSGSRARYAPPGAR